MANQHAFTSSRSCDPPLSMVVDTIKKAALRGQCCLVVFLDIQGAFDNLLVDSIDRQLRELQVHLDITDWYSHLLRNRRISCDINGATKSRQPMKGTPQGGVLSANIYAITVQPLLNKFRTCPVRAIGFADDTLLLTTGCDLGTLRQLMQRALRTTLEWGHEERLIFNPSKTTAMIFHLLNKPQTINRLTMAGQPINFVDNTRYLGVTTGFPARGPRKV